MTNLLEIKDSPVQMHYSPDGHVQLGPCYSVQLPNALPVGNGWSQSCPDRSELVACRRKHERVVAAYEVALGHLSQTADLVRKISKELEECKSNHNESNEVRALKEALKNARTFVREVANVTSRDFASAIGITATQLSAWTSETPTAPPDFVD